MLRILDRYLLRELAFGIVATAAVLLVVTLGGTMASILDRVARGRLPANLVFELLGLRTVDALTILLPVSIFLGVLLAYGRLWRDNEMAVLQSSGLPITGLLRPLAIFVVPASLLLGMVSFWLAPAAMRLSHDLVDEANRSMVVAGLEPGRFMELPGRSGTIYVASMNDDGTRFERMFVESERPDGEDIRLDVITAEAGELRHDGDGQSRFLSLANGFRVEGRIGYDDFRLLRFKQNDIALGENATDSTPESLKRSAPIADLLASKEQAQKAELHWRLAAPLSALILAVLALPLSRSGPRVSHFGKLLLAIPCYLIYANLLEFGRVAITQGKVAPAIGLWWVHLPMALLTFWLLRRSDLLPAPKASH
ncbi:LPS export ABC transporter permease LptF [Tahibacter amnicola]|uniref:Lipopolysaccharide export system permease protein LptF n=1 Tax=Tahibacter amnicola TaxID=2976241 RepID=A0ABY6BCZ5_9GAMM|nr:LPS export ABC transporter permease LptF [Tahibacter amnicola]UXI67913.1 LPS export ABC transporter permease LptF [Tahibacter amnicola]